MLNFLLRQVVIEFKMEFFSRLKIKISAISVAFLFSVSYVTAEGQLKIIERDNFQKRIRVDAMTDKHTGQLKDYLTFSFYVKEQLIFCHMSKDQSEPAVICH